MKISPDTRFLRFSRKSSPDTRFLRFCRICRPHPHALGALALALALALGLGAPPAAAAGGARGKAATAAKPSPSAVPTPLVSGTSGATLVSKPGVKGKTAKTLIFDPLKIEGRVAKPRSIFTLERSKGPAFGQLAPDEDFTPKILDSVEGDPF